MLGFGYREFLPRRWSAVAHVFQSVGTTTHRWVLGLTGSCCPWGLPSPRRRTGKGEDSYEFHWIQRSDRPGLCEGMVSLGSMYWYLGWILCTVRWPLLSWAAGLRQKEEVFQRCTIWFHVVVILTMNCSRRLRRSARTSPPSLLATAEKKFRSAIHWRWNR